VPLVEALQRERAEWLRELRFSTADHSFSGQRIRLAREVTRWLVESCESSDSQPVGSAAADVGIPDAARVQDRVVLK